MKISLLPHQKEMLKSTKGYNRVGYFMEMGTGKTFVSSMKANELGVDILIVCPKSLINMWQEHYQNYYPHHTVYDLSKPKEYVAFFKHRKGKRVGIINYDLIFRRVELSTLRNYTLLLDESSLIKNETTKRSKFILNKLCPENVILCSGTVCGGKYEHLWSQMRLLGWNISKRAFWNSYIQYRVDTSQGFPITFVYGYKYVEDLKRRIHQHGGRFLKTEDVLDLPEQIHTTIKCDTTPEYRKFMRNSIVKVSDVELVGDTVLTKLLYSRMLCGQYNPKKVEALRDIIRSTEDRLVIFYCFNGELEIIRKIADEEKRPLSIVNGSVKDLEDYEHFSDSITAIQIQAGSMGLNLQKANKIVYFTPPLSSEQFEQSKKRTHRIGQTRSCFYYYLTCSGSVEEKIYCSLAKRRDYSENLFRGDFD